MSSPDQGARRVVITSPRTRAPRRQPQRVVSEINAQTRLGQVYMGSLMRAQGRLAVLTLFVLAVLLLGLPLLFRLVPSVAAATVFGIPLPWLLLGLIVYPVLLFVGWMYVRQAERNEQDFAEAVSAGDQERSADGSAARGGR